jgi:hypothetical protein
MGWVTKKRHMTVEHRLARAVQTLQADVHSSPASSRLNCRSCRFKWTRPFCRKMKAGFCACAITFQTQSTNLSDNPHPYLSFLAQGNSIINTVRSIASHRRDGDRLELSARPQGQRENGRLYWRLVGSRTGVDGKTAPTCCFDLSLRLVITTPCRHWRAGRTPCILKAGKDGGQVQASAALSPGVIPHYSSNARTGRFNNRCGGFVENKNLLTLS